MKRRRGLVWIVVTLVVLAMVVYGFLPRAVLVDAVLVDRGRLEVVVEEEGRTRVIDRFLVSAPVAGEARRIELRVGDDVKSGQVLVEIDAPRPRVLDPRSRAEAEARLLGASAAVQRAREAAEAARAEAVFHASEAERVRSLAAEGISSPLAVEQAQMAERSAAAALRSAEFAVDVARFEEEAARVALKLASEDGGSGPREQVAVRSPVAGRVLQVVHESAGFVQAGEPLIEVGDPRALEVEIDVLSPDGVRIGPGTRVVFERWGGDAPLEGRVRRVEPVAFTKISALGVEEQRVWVRADITSPPEEWARLGDAYRVEAKIILWESDDVLRVPAGALFRRRDGWAVFVVGPDGKASARTVEIGRRGRLYAEVRSGLTAGAIVVAHPDETVEDGVALRVRESDD